MSNLNFIIDAYNAEVKDLPRIHKEYGGGKARNASGVIFENFIRSLCVNNSLTAKKNDYKRTAEINGIFLKNLQVDKHIYKNNVMKKAVEGKSYLDLCYLKRAVLDFIELDTSPDVPDDVEYAILAGQECVSKDSLDYYSAYFKKMTSKDLNLFVINTQKRRNPKKAIYMKEYNMHFQLDIKEVNRFVEWLQK